MTFVTLVTLYVLGSLSTLAAVALIAVRLRRSHAMSVAATSLLILVTGLVWPLLVIAAVQAGVLLGLSKGLGAIVPHGNRGLPPIAVSEPEGADLPAVA